MHSTQKAHDTTLDDENNHNIITLTKGPPHTGKQTCASDLGDARHVTCLSVYLQSGIRFLKNVNVSIYVARLGINSYNLLLARHIIISTNSASNSLAIYGAI